MHNVPFALVCQVQTCTDEEGPAIETSGAPRSLERDMENAQLIQRLQAREAELRAAHEELQQLRQEVGQFKAMCTKWKLRVSVAEARGFRGSWPDAEIYLCVTVDRSTETTSCKMMSSTVVWNERLAFEEDDLADLRLQVLHGQTRQMLSAGSLVVDAAMQRQLQTGPVRCVVDTMGDSTRAVQVEIVVEDVGHRQQRSSTGDPQAHFIQLEEQLRVTKGELAALKQANDGDCEKLRQELEQCRYALADSQQEAARAWVHARMSPLVQQQERNDTLQQLVLEKETEVLHLQHEIERLSAQLHDTVQQAGACTEEQMEGQGVPNSLQGDESQPLQEVSHLQTIINRQAQQLKDVGGIIERQGKQLEEAMAQNCRLVEQIESEMGMIHKRPHDPEALERLSMLESQLSVLTNQGAQLKEELEASRCDCDFASCPSGRHLGACWHLFHESAMTGCSLVFFLMQ